MKMSLCDSALSPTVKEVQDIIDALDGPLKHSFENVNVGYPHFTVERFLRARDQDVVKASKMLITCLQWRVDNQIDSILSRPISPKETYDTIRESYLMGFCGNCKKGRPVFAVGVGKSTFDKVPIDKYVQSHIQMNEYRDKVMLPEMRMKSQQYVGTCVKIFDMTGLGFSAFTRIKVLTAIATVDDLNYPEKTDVYYIVNAPYVFSACWKAVKPMLQDKTKQKVQILKDNGRDELLEVMDPDTLPLFCRGIRGEGSSSSSSSLRGYCDLAFNCFSSSHRFHVELYDYMLKESARKCSKDGKEPQCPVHIRVPSLGAQGESAELSEVVQVIKSVSTTLEAVKQDILLDRNPHSSTSVAAIRGRSRQILWSILMILALYFVRGLLLD